MGRLYILPRVTQAVSGRAVMRTRVVSPFSTRQCSLSLAFIYAHHIVLNCYWRVDFHSRLCFYKSRAVPHWYLRAQGPANPQKDCCLGQSIDLSFAILGYVSTPAFFSKCYFINAKHFLKKLAFKMQLELNSALLRIYGRSSKWFHF